MSKAEDKAKQRALEKYPLMADDYKGGKSMKQIWQKIKRWPIMTPIFRMLHPFDSTCGICGLPWSSCKPDHTINMVECTDDHCGEGFFPVCEYCWQHAGLPAILTAVRRLHNMWLQQDHHPYDIDDMIEVTKLDYYKGMMRRLRKRMM